MFVTSTFVGSLDRLSVKSVVLGKTGTFLGLAATLGFILACFFIFLPSVISYFQGDFIQGTYTTLKDYNLSLYSSCDFKIAIQFKQKLTNQIVDHHFLKKYVNTRVLYISPSQRFYYTKCLPCSIDYFSQQLNKPQTIKPEDCYVAPNYLNFKSENLNNFYSVFGFTMEPVCPDPFTCTSKSIINKQMNDYRLNFYKNHYFVFKFATNYLDKKGNLVKAFYQVYSTQWQARQTIIPIMYTALQVAQVYLDNSVMPWINNQTIVYSQWLGLSQAKFPSQSTLEGFGVGSFLSIPSILRIYTRQYKKLDYLFGMLGGGILLLYLIFWVPCNFIATFKSKIYTASSTVVIRNRDQNLKSYQNTHFPDFMSPLWMASQWLKIKIEKYNEMNRSIQHSQRLLDIVNLIKKMKVSMRNLGKNKVLHFEPEQQYSLSHTEQLTSQQTKLQICKQFLSQVRSNSQIPKICSGNLQMLVLFNKDSESCSQLAQQQIKQILREQQYSKIKSIQFRDNQAGKCSKICKSIAQVIKKIIRAFDVFGAKPSLCGSPHNYTIFGCILTLLIVILSILTFALTLKNMSFTRVYWDEIYQPANAQNIRINTYQQFRFALCLSSSVAAIDKNLVTGPNKVADLKFCQYRRQNQIQSQQCSSMIPIRSQSLNYFDMTSSSYSKFNFSNCMKARDNMEIQIYGDPSTVSQAYVFIKITPYCLNISGSCLNQTQNFVNYASSQVFTMILPQAKYFPQEQKIKIDPTSRQVIRTIYMSDPKSIHQDDRDQWMMGAFPSPKQVYLLAGVESGGKSQLNSVTSPTLEIKIKFSLTGQVQRVISTNYKIDFLLSVIGGCFAFYYFILGWIGEKFNNFNLKLKMAQLIYGFQASELSKGRLFLQYLNFPFSRHKTFINVDNDMNCLKICKNVDTIYRLSVINFETAIQKKLGLIYLQQKIKSGDKLTKNKKNKAQEISQQENQQDDQPNTEGVSGNGNKVANLKEQESLQNEKQTGVQVEEQNQQKMQPTIRNIEKCGSLVKTFDMFNCQAQFTLDGKRKVRSVCGGIVCILLTIFICLLVSHFLTLYFNQWFRVSFQKITSTDPSQLNMTFKVGQNMKLGLSFFQFPFFNFSNVSDYNMIGMSIFKYKTERLQNQIKTTTEIIDLQSCKVDYFDGFINNMNSAKFYQNIVRGFCVPDGTELRLYGTSNDRVREYFSLRVYNYSDPNKTSLTNTLSLFQKYSIRYHISSPIVDFQSSSGLTYSVTDILRQTTSQLNQSTVYNLTLVKNKITYDTAVYSNFERPSFSSYDIKSVQTSTDYKSSMAEVNNSYCQLNFVSQNIYNHYTVKGIKANELFGIVGGCIALLFFGLGCLPRSFNQYRMRYIIGTRLYYIESKRHSQYKNEKGRPKRIQGQELSLRQLSQIQLLFAWFCSFFASILSKFEINSYVKLVALYQSRVSQDINVFQLTKSIVSCRNALKQLPQTKNSPNLCKIFTKHIINVQERNEQSIQALKQQIIFHEPKLKELAKRQKFSEWELKTILEAKQKQVKFDKIFGQKAALCKIMNKQNKSVSSNSKIMGKQQSLENLAFQQSEINEQKNSNKKLIQGDELNINQSKIQDQQQMRKQETEEKQNNQFQFQDS